MHTKQQFLDAMGIDIWLLRQNLLDGQPTEALLAAEPATAAEADSETPSETLSETLLEETAPAPESTVERSSVLADTDLKTTPQEEPRPPPPRFTLALLQYEQLGLCLSLSPSGASIRASTSASSGASTSASSNMPSNKSSETKIPQRFCDDLARAFGKKPETTNCQLIEWPELTSPHIDQSMAVAADVVAHKFSFLPNIVLVFGEVVKQYHPGLEALTPTNPVQLGTQKVYLFDEVGSIMHSADAKRALWRWFQEQFQEGLQEGLPQTLASPEAE